MTQIKEITLPSGRYLLVAVPKGATEFRIIGIEQGPLLEYKVKPGMWEMPILPPSHHYTLLGLCSEIGEDVAKGVVHKHRLKEDHYSNYVKNTFPVTLPTAIESLHSLCLSYNMQPGETVMLKIEKHDP